MIFNDRINIDKHLQKILQPVKRKHRGGIAQRVRTVGVRLDEETVDTGSNRSPR